MADEKKELGFIDEISESGITVDDNLSDEQKGNLNNDGHVDFGEEAPNDKNESDKSEEKETDTTSTKKEESSEKESSEKELQAALELTEKRRKDTEKAFQKEHQENLRLQAELEAAKKVESTRDKSDEDDDEDDTDLLFGIDDPDDDKVKNGDGQTKTKSDGDTAIKQELEEVKRKQEELENQRNIDAWKVEADKVAAKHKDFEEIVYNVFHEALEASPKIQEDFKKKGSTPEAAYELGLKIKAYNDAIDGKKNNQKEEDSDNTLETGLDPESALGGNSASTVKKTSSSPNDVVGNVKSALDFL